MTKNRVLRYIFDFAVSAVVGLIVLVSVEYSYARFYPTKWVFEYKKLESTKPMFQIGEQLRFKSTSVYRKAKDLTWNDTLHCDFGAGDVYFSSQTTQSDNFVPKKGLGNMLATEWAYNGEIPKEPAICHVISVVTVREDFGIHKETVVESNDFEIK